MKCLLKPLSIWMQKHTVLLHTELLPTLIDIFNPQMEGDVKAMIFTDTIVCTIIPG